jgi:predicted outer membrane repeat protein
LSEKNGETKVAYNHALKIGGALKAAGKLAISKDGNIVPTEEEVEGAVAHYRENNDIKVIEPKAAKKESVSTQAQTKTQTQTQNQAQSKSKTKQEEEQDMETYSFIIGGKSYERGDIDGKAFIWDAKGTYMGVYNEKTKKFDTSIPDPTIV